jgi:hypothetical protein
MQIGLEPLELGHPAATFPNALKLAFAKHRQPSSLVLSIASANTAPNDIARIPNPVYLAGLNCWLIDVFQN